jgi:hypothetical protein
MDQVLLSSEVNKGTKVVMTKEVAAIAQAVDDDDPPSNE